MKEFPLPLSGSTWSRWISRIKECLSTSWWNTTKTLVKTSLNIDSMHLKIHVEWRGINSKYRECHTKMYQVWVSALPFYNIAFKLGELPAACFQDKQTRLLSHKLTMQFSNNMDIILRKRLSILILISGHVWIWIVSFLLSFFLLLTNFFFILWCFCFQRFNVRQNRNIKDKT